MLWLWSPRMPSDPRVVDGLVGPDALGELELAPAFGEEPLGSQDHHDHEQEAEDPDLQVGDADAVEAELPRDVGRIEDVRQLSVDEGERDGADHDAPDA